MEEKKREIGVKEGKERKKEKMAVKEERKKGR